MTVDKIFAIEIAYIKRVPALLTNYYETTNIKSLCTLPYSR